MTRRARALRVAAGIGAALLLAPAIAAQVSDTARRDTTARDSTRAQRLAPVVITGTRLSSAADEKTPVQVDVVDLHTAPPGPAATANLLTHLPGVNLWNDQGTRAQPTLELRGFTLSPVVGVPQGVSVFLDGVRINEPDAQELNFDLIPVEAVERAELVRGATATYGKNTLAGALNLYTARGSATPQMEGEVEAGAWGQRGVHVVASGLRDGIDGYLMAKLSDEDGWRAQSRASLRTIFANVGRKRDSSDLALTLLYAHDDISEAGSLPESWLATARRANYTSGDYFRPDLVHVALRGTRSFGEAQLRGNAYVRRNYMQQFNVNVSDPNSRSLVTNTSVGATGELGVPVTVAARPLGITVGGEAARNDIAYRLFQQATPAAPDLPPDCDQSSGLCEDARVKQDDAALYAQLLYELTSRASLLVSGRGDYVRVPFRDRREPANDGTSTFTRFSPKFGLSYDFSDEFRGYASVGSGFRAPAALELACASPTAPCPLPFSLGADPPLHPVTVWNYETGIDWEPWHGASLDLVGYRAEVHDEIVFAASRTAAGYFQNVPRTRRQGIETSTKIALPHGVRLFGSYTLTDATYQSTIQLASAIDTARPARPGDRFPLSPRHRLTYGVGAVRVLHSMVLDGELSARTVSSQFLRGDEANDFSPLPSYTVADLRLTLVHPRFALTAYLTNLFDVKYLTYGVYGENPKGPPAGPPPPQPTIDRFVTPGEPLAITVSLSVKR